METLGVGAMSAGGVAIGFLPQSQPSQVDVGVFPLLAERVTQPPGVPDPRLGHAILAMEASSLL